MCNVWKLVATTPTNILDGELSNNNNDFKLSTFIEKLTILCVYRGLSCIFKVSCKLAFVPGRNQTETSYYQFSKKGGKETGVNMKKAVSLFALKIMKLFVQNANFFRIFNLTFSEHILTRNVLNMF